MMGGAGGGTASSNNASNGTVQLAAAAGRFFGSGVGGAGGGSGTINIQMLSKMLAAADDVGRRAVNVAHVGDTRAYLAMKMIMSSTDCGSVSSALSVTPMEGVEEETFGGGGEGGGGDAGSTSDNSSFSAYLSRTRAMSNDRTLTRVSKPSIKQQQ